MRLFAVAGDKGNGGPFVQKFRHGLGLTGGNAQLFCDLLKKLHRGSFGSVKKQGRKGGGRSRECIPFLHMPGKNTWSGAEKTPRPASMLRRCHISIRGHARGPRRPSRMPHYTGKRGKRGRTRQACKSGCLTSARSGRQTSRK
ncbi:hypothetical protein KL86DES1_21136 [uncultured Desulfovibrio sp.]|uniref:Uncharacterized protein n=1 Tax=uncultured Desulfovibrio sp. TaxID=167968 RepID=A0A212L6R1_9BACT|nr:hypothetical protein KL86DES1_21136 [uncultured Desulfovibrio sp.]VZH34032.1 conserved protein of unknown function [Desulfovibrio sp. 86]